MAVYRQIHTSFWQDPFVLELTPEEKYFYLYLMTNSKTTQCGVYELTKKVMELETGYNRETIDKLLARFIEYGKIEYSEESKEILIKNWLKYNGSKSPKVIACIEKELREIKCLEFLRYCMDSLSIDYGEEKEKEKNNNNNNKKNNKEIESVFENLWKLYPKKEGKGQVSKTQKEKIADIGLEEMTRAIERYNLAKKGTERQFMQNGSTFFNSGYVDYLDKNYQDTEPKKSKYDQVYL